MSKGKVLLAGDSYTKSWDNYQFKSEAFTVHGRGLKTPTTYAQKYIAYNGCISSAKLFFEMSGYDATDIGMPGGSNSEAISAIEQNISEHDYVVVFLTSPSRDLETRAYPEFKDYVLRMDKDIHWVHKISNNHTYSRLRDIAQTHKTHVLCIGGLDPIDVDIFSKYKNEYLRLVMPWCLSYLAPTLKENVKRNIRWGYLHDCGALDASSLNIMPEIDQSRPNHTHLLYRDQDNWSDIEPYLWPDDGHLNLNAMWRVVDAIVLYMENNNIR